MQSVTVPSSRVSLECRSPGLRSPPLEMPEFAAAWYDTHHLRIGNVPKTVSESTVSKTELSEFFDPHRVPRRELCEFLSACYLCTKVDSPSFAQNSPSLLQNSVSSLLRNITLEAVFRSFPKFRTKKNSLKIQFSAGCSWDIRGPDVGISRTKNVMQVAFSVVLDKGWRDVQGFGPGRPGFGKA